MKIIPKIGSYFCQTTTGAESLELLSLQQENTQVKKTAQQLVIWLRLEIEINSDRSKKRLAHPVVLHMVRVVLVVRAVMMVRRGEVGVVRAGRLLTMGVVGRGRTMRRERMRQLT